MRDLLAGRGQASPLVCAWYNLPMSKLVIICGISFAGKSTLGEAIAKRFDYAQVDVDDMKFHL